MRIVVVGAGSVGFSIASELSKEGHDIVVIDKSQIPLTELEESQSNILTVMGNGASLSVQKRANVEGSDLLIASTQSDEVNMLCCLLANKLGCRQTICRIRNSEYSGQVQYMQKELGVSMTFNPEQAAASEIYRIIKFPSFLHRDVFANGKIELVGINIHQGSKLAGRRLDQLESIIKTKILVCAVERGEDITIPNGSFTLMEGDRITVTAPKSAINTLVKNLGIVTQKIREVMIIGGSSIAVYLTEALIQSGVSVKIIERDPKRCEYLCERLPKALIIYGDGSKQDILREEGIRETDAIVALTDIDEENLILAIFSNHVGVPKTIMKINRMEYSHLFLDRSIGSMVYPKQIVASDVIRYVRAMSNTTGEAMRSLHRIVDGKAEALEFSVVSDSRFVDKPLAQLKMKKDILISSISRAGKVIIPQGSDSLQVDDTVVIVARSDMMIDDLSDIFIGLD